MYTIIAKQVYDKYTTSLGIVRCLEVSHGNGQSVHSADLYKPCPELTTVHSKFQQFKKKSYHQLTMLYIWICMFLGLAAAAPQYDDDKIINGYECAQHSQPWQVYISYNGGQWCAGSLISSQWIISAAHCYKPPNTFIAHLGEHDVTKQEGTEQRIQVEKAIMHPLYDEESADHDFMLVKLAKPAQFNQYVQPIPVASSCPTAGSQCLVSGWGNMRIIGVQYATKLQCLDLPVLSDSSCKASYSNMITSNMFCAGFLEGGKDACSADSGGPLVCNGKLYGVVSWGRMCALRNYPGVYTKVCNYFDWIKNIIEQN
ncbi:trypsin-3-like [Rana temporaria]|uniref:trypsin-3-like n=1 Tax=Rana temporaria TaxID=8407 RepID=UPI001AADB3F3|nr:trypsin-3-like [Rana temporaria]